MATRTQARRLVGAGSRRRIDQFIANQEKYRSHNAFISLADPTWLEQQVTHAKSQTQEQRKKQGGKLIAIKDNICTTDLPTTAASGILKSFTSPYDATVVKQLRDEGCIVVGKTNMDEFGMGSHSKNSHFGPVRFDNDRGSSFSAGGSSGGSAVAVATYQCDAALGTDTGGSVRLPAAYTDIVGFKPSYGLLSRWGVITYANSLDTVGIFARDGDEIREDKNAVDHVRTLFDIMNKHDPQDPTSLPLSTRARLGSPRPERPLRIGIPVEYNIATLSPEVKETWIHALRVLRARGHSLHTVSLPATQHALSAYYVLAPAEASSNLAKYDGVRYGSRAEGIDGTPDSMLFARTRGHGFGPEVQRRILLGAFSLSADAIDNYFIQAQKVRRLVQQDFNNVFASPNPLTTTDTERNEQGVDVLLCPTAPTPSPSLYNLAQKEAEGQHFCGHKNDVFTVPASLAGLPAISIPIRKPPADTRISHANFKHPSIGKKQFGMQLIGQFGDDHLVIDVAEELMKADEAFFAPNPNRNLLDKEQAMKIYGQGNMRHGGGHGFENTNGEIWPGRQRKIPAVGAVDRYPKHAEKKDKKRASVLGMELDAYKKMKAEMEANGVNILDLVIAKKEVYTNYKGSGMSKAEYEDLESQARGEGVDVEDLVRSRKDIQKRETERVARLKWWYETLREQSEGKGRRNDMSELEATAQEEEGKKMRTGR